MNLTHEWQGLLEKGELWQTLNLKMVLATVVELEGSSYRRPGVRMLINEKDEMCGAVSGGCVEKEVRRHAQSVFESGTPKMMTYDGRFRLGCEGMIHLLIEPFKPEKSTFEAIKTAITERQPFQAEVFFDLEEANLSLLEQMGSFLTINKQIFSLRPTIQQPLEENFKSFSQNFPAAFQLFIFGAEHDAVQLSKMAYQLGWSVHIIAAPDEEKASWILRVHSA